MRLPKGMGSSSNLSLVPPFLNRLVSRAHDVWNGAAAGNTADMRGVDIPRLPVFIWIKVLPLH